MILLLWLRSRWSRRVWERFGHPGEKSGGANGPRCKRGHRPISHFILRKSILTRNDLNPFTFGFILYRLTQEKEFCVQCVVFISTKRTGERTGFNILMICALCMTQVEAFDISWRMWEVHYKCVKAEAEVPDWLSSGPWQGKGVLAVWVGRMRNNDLLLRDVYRYTDSFNPVSEFRVWVHYYCIKINIFNLFSLAKNPINKMYVVSWYGFFWMSLSPWMSHLVFLGTNMQVLF